MAARRRELGGGGMSKVFRATDTALGRTVVVKTIARHVEALERRQWVEPMFIAVAYAAIGDVGHTMQWRETSFRKRRPACVGS